MMWLLVWAGVGVLAGICCIIFVPWTAARIAGLEAQEYISDIYVWLAQTAATKTAIVARSGSLELVGKRWDPDIGADKDTAQGDPRHHRDGFGVLSRLANKPFGFALQSHNEYVDPLLAEIGAKARRAIDEGDVGPQGKVMLDGIHIPDRSKLVDITNARHLPTGDCEPEQGHEDYVKTKISQEKFHERLSFGQTMVIMLAFVGSMVVMWFLTGQDAPSTGGTTVSLLVLLASTSRFDLDLRTLGAVAFAVLWVVGIPLIALVTHGALAAVLVFGLMASIAVTVPLGIALLGPSIPLLLGVPLARGFWILAQLTVGRGVIVRRATGEYEHHALVEAGDDVDHDFEAVLDDGTGLPIDGSRGDLFRFAWAPLGVTAEKSAANMRPITETPPEEAVTDGGKVQSANVRQGYQALLDVPDDDEWLITLPQLWTWARKTAESEAIERGRNKALTEHGGQQQIGMIAFTGALLASMVIGSVMGFLAGGGL